MINRLGIDLVILELNGLLNVCDRVILDLSVDQEDFRGIKNFIDDKGARMVTIYIKESDESLYRSYIDHYRDLHPAHKVRELLSLKDFMEFRYLIDLAKIPYNYITHLDLPNLEEEIKKIII
jgi:hypothetical protein